MLTPLTDADPRSIGTYRLSGRLGAGGMGTVYLGFDVDGQARAVKVIRSDALDDLTFRKRFRREVAAARVVRSDFVAEIRDADVDAAHPWMATEYIDGVSLSVAVADRGRLDGTMLVGLASGLADGLVAVHDAGLVHRDLKPANILLAWNGPKIIDFGVARFSDGATSTSAGALIGTVAWMAPEQLRGERAGPAADIFAWAMCTTFAALGRHPFPAERAEVSAIRILNDSPDIAGAPPELVPLLLAALAKEPAARPTAIDLVRALVGPDITGAAAARDATRRLIGREWRPPGPASPVAAAARTARPGSLPRPMPRRAQPRASRRISLRRVVLVGVVAAMALQAGVLQSGVFQAGATAVALAVIVTAAVGARRYMNRHGAISGPARSRQAGWRRPWPDRRM
jgi:eukaryotic-like serine/threonine-protein kinase